MNRWWFAGAMAAAFAVGSLVAAERSAANMASAATKFLASLSPEQRQKATFAFDTEERRHWHFIPTEMFPRQGLLMRDMNESQRKLAHELMKSALSQRGYMTASSIMELEKDRKSTRLNSSHLGNSYGVFCLKKKTIFKKQPINYALKRFTGDKARSM